MTKVAFEPARSAEMFVIFVMENMADVSYLLHSLVFLRICCIFNTSAILYFEGEDSFDLSYFNDISRSDFFEALCAAVSGGRR